jgi:hypothetical protein
MLSGQLSGCLYFQLELQEVNSIVWIQRGEVFSALSSWAGHLRIFEVILAWSSDGLCPHSRQQGAVF